MDYFDYFDIEEKKQKEKEERELYEKLYKKQAAMAKKTVLLVLGSISLIFIIAGIFFLCFSGGNYDVFIIGVVFLPSGIFTLLLGIILYAVIPAKGNYERYKKNKARYAAWWDKSSIQGLLLENNVNHLEDKIKDLEKRIEELERRR